MSRDDLAPERLAKASRRAAVVSLSGVLIVVLSLVYSTYRLAALRTEIGELQQKRTDLKKDVATLQGQLTEIKASIQGLTYANVTPQNEVFQLKASARALPGVKTPDGRPVYKFRVYVDGSASVLESIARVAYDFNHPTFRQPHVESTDRSNSFMVQYTGWGCLTEVDVTVYLQNGKSQSIGFDMCKSLGADWTNQG
ncbi:MAG: pYEATS domain-containing protein [Chlamydiota bacterium]